MVPADESVRLDNDEGAPPVEELAENGQEQSRRIDCSERLDFAFLVQSQLLPQEQILGG